MHGVDFQHQNVEYYKTRVCVAVQLLCSAFHGGTVHGIGELVEYTTKIRTLFTKHPITFRDNDDLQ